MVSRVEWRCTTYWYTLRITEPKIRWITRLFSFGTGSNFVCAHDGHEPSKETFGKWTNAATRHVSSKPPQTRFPFPEDNFFNILLHWSHIPSNSGNILPADFRHPTSRVGKRGNFPFVFSALLSSLNSFPSLMTKTNITNIIYAFPTLQAMTYIFHFIKPMQWLADGWLVNRSVRWLVVSLAGWLVGRYHFLAALSPLWGRVQIQRSWKSGWHGKIILLLNQIRSHSHFC